MTVFAMLAASSLAGVNCFTNITSPCVPPTIPDYICPGNNESTIYVQENQSSGYWNKKSSIMTCNWICYPNSGEEVRKPTRLLLLRQLPTIGDAHRDPALELYTANRSMTTNKPIIKPNLAAAIAFAILMAFAVGKVLALASGSPALDRLHPLLPGTYRSVTNFAFSIELVSIFIWCLWGTKRFLQICGGLAVTYLSYHITSEVFGSRDSCSCLGQFTFWSEWVRRNERLLSISGSVALLSLSVFGLTPNACKVANNEIYTGVTKLSLNTANAVLLWLLCWVSGLYWTQRRFRRR